MSVPRRLALLIAVALTVAACHTTHRGHFATTPVPLALVPFGEPVRLVLDTPFGRAGDAVPARNGLLASYFAGALYDRLDHQQIDPAIDFDWNADNQNPVVSGPESLDTNEGIGGFIGLPSTWGIWSIAWEGYLDVPADGSYGLRLHVNNGGWLEMKDGTGGLQTVLSCPGGPGFEGDCDATLTLAKGKQYIRVSYYQNGPPSANAHLSWQKPGDLGFSIVPTGSLCTQNVAGCATQRRRPVIFIPGLLGSELSATAGGSLTTTVSDGSTRTFAYHRGDVIWPHFDTRRFPPDVTTLLLNPEFYNLLRFGTDGLPLVPSIAPNGHLYVDQDGYGGVEPFFTSHGYVPGQSFFVFTWDWRFPAVSHVGTLDEFVGTVLATSGADSVDIVAHSQGTFVTRAFLLAGSRRTKVSHVVMLGSPGMGTPKGSDAIIAGECVQQVGPICILPPQTTRYILRTLPGVLENAVSPAYYQFFQDQIGPGLFRPLPYRVEPVGGDQVLPPEEFTYSFLRGIEIDRGAVPSALASAEQLHSTDTTWLGQVLRTTNTKITFGAGSGQCAVGELRERTVAVITQPLVGHPSVQIKTARDYVMIDGDTVVVRQTAALGETSTADFASGAPDPDRVSVFFRNSSHADLAGPVGLPAALAAIRDESFDRGTIANPDCAVVSVHSPMELGVTDSAGHRAGSFGEPGTFVEIPTATYARSGDMKFVSLSGAGPYTATLTGTGSGEAIVRIRWIHGEVAREGVFLHVPTSSTTRASMSFDTGTGMVGPLAVDTDGDGVADLTLRATILVGAAAGDTTKPALTLVSPSASQSVVGSFQLGWTATDAQSGIDATFASLDRGSSTEQLVSAPGPLQLSSGIHTVDVFAEDRAGNFTSLRRTFTADSFSWLPPVEADGSLVGNAGRTVPVKFTVTSPDGAFVSDQSVRADVLDGSGAVIAGPFVLDNTPSSGVVIQGTTYHVNVQTKGLVPGHYSVRVRFSSGTLIGEITIPLTLR